ncbi:MAG TPA: PH domain-containing protein, partial [Candidatus Thermoplasmatota archaeon]|nr:PH domain-containing protein [Candidatus Thermoplasmatota archaeon]
MGSLPLVAGERLVRSLRPTPLAFAHLYALPLATAAWGLALVGLFTDPGFLAFARGDFGAWYKNETPIAYVVWALGLVGIAFGSHWLSRGLRWPLLTLSFTLLWGLAAGFLFTTATVLALAWGTFAFGTLGLLVVEAHRRTHRYHVTDRRLVLEGGLWKRRDAQHPLSAVRGLEAHQTLPGRLFRFGTLVPRVDGV